MAKIATLAEPLDECLLPNQMHPAEMKIFLAISLALYLVSGGLCSWAIEEPLDPKSIRTMEGFEVELLRAANPGEDSWISMSHDNKGRIIIGLDKVGVARLTLDPSGPVKFEKIESTLKHCRGVLYAHGSIYINSTDSRVLVRLSDVDSDDHFETSEKLIEFDYRSRYGHGANQLRLGRDGKIYIMVGNDVSFPPATLDNSAYRDPQNDWLLPKQRDLGQDNRVGYLLRIDPDGNNREVIAGGFRNPVDMDFDPNGEMFTFDADMEWDIGAPWYRPIRVNHIVSGGEYGWRWGTGKWPADYADSLPSNLDIGMGSPTGVAFGTGSEFPPRYQHALFLADWQNGKILAAVAKPQGASYSFEYESFLDGAPLNVCDIEFGADGKLYFITGGRGSQSALYRVSWKGKRQKRTKYPPLNELQLRRRTIESLHSSAIQRQAVDKAWADLDHADPWIRNAARVTVEKTPIRSWEKRALNEPDFKVSLQALLALARQKKCDDSEKARFVEACGSRIVELMEARGSESGKIADREIADMIRVAGILFARNGPPKVKLAQRFFRTFHPSFPSHQEYLNQELCEFFVFLGQHQELRKEPDWQKKFHEAVTLLSENSQSQETQIHLARSLAHIPQPWSNADLKSYAEWLLRARNFRGGHLLPKTIVQMQTDFANAISKSELPAKTKSGLAKRLQNPEPQSVVSPVNSQRVFVKSWTVADLKDLDTTKGDRRRGRQIFLEALCGNCHRKGDIGSRVGPDLTNVAGRFNRSALLESIIEPSRQIDPKYAISTYATFDGKTHTGRVHSVNARNLTLEIDPILQTTITLKRDDIESTRPAKTSPMPTGLVNHFSIAEINDLLSFLLTR